MGLKAATTQQEADNSNRMRRKLIAALIDVVVRRWLKAKETAIHVDNLPIQQHRWRGLRSVHISHARECDT